MANEPILTEQIILSNGQTVPSTNNSQQTIKLSKIKLINQPARQRHNRTLNDLRDNKCPAIQVEGGTQSTPLKIEVYLEKNSLFYLFIFYSFYLASK